MSPVMKCEQTLGFFFLCIVTAPRAAPARDQTPVQLTTNLREVSQCPENAPTKASPC